jgi:hypothetical protein
LKVGRETVEKNMFENINITENKKSEEKIVRG